MSNANGNRHLLLWIDTETTALRPEDGQLLEIGMRITNLDDTGRTHMHRKA